MQILKRKIEANETRGEGGIQASINSENRLTIILMSEDKEKKNKCLIREDLILNLTQSETKYLKTFLDKINI